MLGPGETGDTPVAELKRKSEEHKAEAARLEQRVLFAQERHGEADDEEAPPPQTGDDSGASAGGDSSSSSPLTPGPPGRGAVVVTLAEAFPNTFGFGEAFKEFEGCASGDRKCDIIEELVRYGTPAHVSVDRANGDLFYDRAPVPPIRRVNLRFGGMIRFGSGFEAFDGKRHPFTDVPFARATYGELVSQPMKFLSLMIDACPMNREERSALIYAPKKELHAKFLASHGVPNGVDLSRSLVMDACRRFPIGFSTQGHSSEAKRFRAKQIANALVSSKGSAEARLEGKPKSRGGGSGALSASRNAEQKRLIALLADHHARVNGHDHADARYRKWWHANYCNPPEAVMCFVCKCMTKKRVFEHWQVVDSDGSVTYYHRCLTCCPNCNIVTVCIVDKLDLPAQDIAEARAPRRERVAAFCYPGYTPPS
ncbi:hypothetical protein JL721_9805 [Aureococcus anophagefferens]|nr:hypothetical protein JL721_9805 [Aureococcus anophagefferens]